MTDTRGCSRWRCAGAALSLLLVLIVPVCLAAKAWHDANSHPVVKVRIAGYDPRDLLHGHYLQYRFDWNWADGQPDAAACAGQECCLCLSGPDTDPRAALAACGQETGGACRALLKGHSWGDGGFDIGFNRYYIPEKHAPALEDVLRGEEKIVRMGLSLRPGNRAVIQGLYIGDSPLNEYLLYNLTDGTHDGTSDDPAGR